MHVDAEQTYEKLLNIRLAYVRLNGYESEANDLGYALRTDISDVLPKISNVGQALGLIPRGYRPVPTAIQQAEQAVSGRIKHTPTQTD